MGIDVTTQWQTRRASAPRRWWLALLAGGWLMAGTGIAVAQAPPAGVPWAQLSPQQQQLLGRFQGQWDSMGPLRQQALSRGSARWLTMTPEEQNGARERFQTWQRLPPEQRAAIRQRWRQFQQLPQERRAQLRERWRAASPQQRQQMLERVRERRSHFFHR